MIGGVLRRIAGETLWASTLLKSAGVYAAARFANSVVPFFLMPVMTRYLSPGDYGIVSMFGVLVGVASPFVGLSIHGAISVRAFDPRETDLPRYVGNCCLLLLASTAGVSAVLWLFSGPVSNLTLFPRSWLWLVVATAAGQFLILTIMTLWQVEKRAGAYGIFQNLQTLTNVALSLALVVGLGLGWRGRIGAQAAAAAAFAALAVLLLRRRGMLTLRFDRERLGHAARFGIPLIPHVLGGMIITQTDRIFITKMVSIADTGMYTVAYQIVSVIDLLMISFNNAYVPWLYEQLAKNDERVKARIVRFTYAAFTVILAGALALALLAPWFLGFFVGEAFAGSRRYVGWMAFGSACSGMYYLVTNYIFVAGKTHLLAWVTFATAVLNVGLNYVLIARNGAVGAAQASAIALLLSFLLTWVLSARVYAMPWRPTARPCAGDGR